MVAWILDPISNGPVTGILQAFTSVKERVQTKDKILLHDILLTKVEFTKSRRLRPETIASLKEFTYP